MMKTIKNKSIAIMVLLTLLVFACKDLTELNQNPNGVPPESVNPNLVISTVITEASKQVVDLGFGDIAGVMQHTQKDAWSNGHNDYDWSDQSWTGYYSILRNNQLVYDRSVELGLEFQQGVSLVMKSFVFGMITDLWGDAPYSQALQGDLGGKENLLPAFDAQASIYSGIIDDLEEANEMLSKEKDAYEIYAPADFIYGGEPMLWRKLANSLQLRYFMRISDKDPAMAKSGIEKIVGDPGKYPLITSSDEDATMDYVGASVTDSWPSNTVYDGTGGSNYRRIKMCATLVDKMQSLADPRLDVWAKKVEVPLVVDENLPAGTDEIVDGVRYLSPDAIAAGSLIDTDPDYVGLPPSVSSLPSAYNLNPTPGQLSFNPHVSFLSEIYKDAEGPLLKARLVSAAEVHFILAEAALKGWATGDAKAHYEAAIKASFEAWGVGEQYDAYMAGPAAYLGTIQQVIEQKWIASWTAATEAWFDYRRTGFPVLEAGLAAKRQVLPVRFYYMQNELNINEQNAEAAVNRLQETAYTQADGKNSAWAKPWLLQGTNEPW